MVSIIGDRVASSPFILRALRVCAARHSRGIPVTLYGPILMIERPLNRDSKTGLECHVTG